MTKIQGPALSRASAFYLGAQIIWGHLAVQKRRWYAKCLIQSVMPNALALCAVLYGTLTASGVPLPLVPRLNSVRTSNAQSRNGILYVARGRRGVTAYDVADAEHPIALSTFAQECGGIRMAWQSSTLPILAVYCQTEYLALQCDVRDPRKVACTEAEASLLPPPPPLPPPSPSAAGPGPAKAGRFMFNAKAGLSIRVFPNPQYSDPTQGLLGGGFALEGGVALNRARSLYLLLSVQLDFFPRPYDTLYTLLFPIGLQYDFAIPEVRGLYFISRLQAGYGRQIFTTAPRCSASKCRQPGSQTVQGIYDAGFFLPELGFKYVSRDSGRYHIGMDVVSLPIVVVPNFSSTYPELEEKGLLIRYRLMLYGGFNF